jgi:hypothetical protein
LGWFGDFVWVCGAAVMYGFETHWAGMVAAVVVAPVVVVAVVA